MATSEAQKRATLRWREKNQDRVRKTVLRAIEKRKARLKNDRLYAEKSRAYHRKYYALRRSDPEYVRRERARTRARLRARRLVDANWRIKCRLRSRLKHALRGACSHSALRLLGCSVDELRSHLERQFKPGMSWGNYGEWEIDHIRPCASFDFSIPGSPEECFRFTNLQPLWKHDNRKKGASYCG